MIRSRSPRPLLNLVVTALMLAASLAASPRPTVAAPKVETYKLTNGMDVVVIPDHRAPVVTHMIWYRVGAADEPKGVSGIAHFLEHLMFKSTDKIPMGEFSKIVAKLGGQDNAFTGQDVTSYFQRIAKEKLRTVMEMEADRMVNLRLTEKEVLTERDVIIEERRSRIENNPNAILDEQMDAALYTNHPYGIPVIGWQEEMAKLSQKDALDFYKRYYAPNNAILVVAGDVTGAEVEALAAEIYGKVPANPATLRDPRPQEPAPRAARRVMLSDPRAGKASLHRDYVVPSYTTAAPGEAEAIDLMMKVAADGATSRLYRALVVEQGVASSAGGGYDGAALDGGKLSFYAVAADDVPLDKIESAMDAVLSDIAKNGVTEKELERAKNSYTAEYIYENDNQSNLARRYGWGLATGRTIEQIETWPEAIGKVTADEVKKAAQTYLDIRRSVTGILTPTPATADAGAARPAPAAPLPANRS